MTKIVKGMWYNLSSESVRNVDAHVYAMWLGAGRAVGRAHDRAHAYERKRR